MSVPSATELQFIYDLFNQKHDTNQVRLAIKSLIKGIVNQDYIEFNNSQNQWVCVQEDLSDDTIQHLTTLGYKCFTKTLSCTSYSAGKTNTIKENTTIIRSIDYISVKQAQPLHTPLPPPPKYDIPGAPRKIPRMSETHAVPHIPPPNFDVPDTPHT